MVIADGDKIKIVPFLGDGDTVDGEPIENYIDRNIGKEIRDHRNGEITEMCNIRYRQVQARLLQRKGARTKKAKTYNEEEKRRYKVEELKQGSKMEMVLAELGNIWADEIKQEKSGKEVHAQLAKKFPGYNLDYLFKKLILTSENFEKYFYKENRNLGKGKVNMIFLTPKETFFQASYGELLGAFKSTNVKGYKPLKERKGRTLSNAIPEPEIGQESIEQDKQGVAIGSKPTAQIMGDFIQALKEMGVKEFSIKF